MSEVMEAAAKAAAFSTSSSSLSSLDRPEDMREFSLSSLLDLLLKWGDESIMSMLG